MLASIRVTSRSPENLFQDHKRHWWVTELYCSNGGSVFIGKNNTFLTPQLGQERCMRFETATRVSNCSNSNVSKF
jgi:hypothetical protein